jgi:hypothetical protein
MLIVLVSNQYQIFNHALSEVWISFSRNSPNWRVAKNFHSPSQKTTGPIHRNCQREEKKLFARLASGSVFLLAYPEFYSHLASWQVVNRTPALLQGHASLPHMVKPVREGVSLCLSVWSMLQY